MALIPVVAMAFEQDGHLNPMLQFCTTLVTFDFSVSFLTPAASIDKLRPRIGKKQHPERIHFVPCTETLKLEASEQLLSYLKDLVTGLAVEHVCLIADSFLGWAQDLANALGMPRISLWTSTARSEVICSNGLLLESKGFLPAGKDDERLVDFLPGLPSFRASQLPLAFRQQELAMIRALSQQMERNKEAHTVLVNTVEELEQEVVDAQRLSRAYLPVGPLIPTSFLEEQERSRDEQLPESDELCLSWLDSHAPSSVLYIAFGSYSNLPVEQVSKLAQGLQDSKQPFLWAFRKNFVEDSPDSFREELVERLAGQGLIVEWTPQAKVLNHVAVCGFLTHCGWNSTMEAVYCGVPTLCWSCAAEQNLNSNLMVEEWRAGLHITEGRDGAVTAEHIAASVVTLLTTEEGKEMRKRMQERQQIMRGAIKPGGSSHNNVCKLVESLRCL